MSEYGLIVIWHNYLDKTDYVLDILSEKFIILECYEIEWTKKLLYKNFYRFYGDRLATSSIKEKSSKGNKLKLIIFEDKSPQYDFRTNARGIEKVNTNLFDTKKVLRKKLHTRFGIHGSNDEVEVNRDLALLLGINLKDYKSKDISRWNGTTISLNRDVTGSNNWASFKEFFYFINAVEPYVLLSNFDNYINMPEGDDIDLLVTDRDKFSYFINAKKLSKGIERSNYSICVNDKIVDVDIRYIGDGYLDRNWELDCIKNRVLYDNKFYIMNNKNLYFSLSYHALVHKMEFPKKYLEYFNLPIEEIKYKLYNFMYENNYKMLEPKDITLYFNKKYGGDIKLSRARRVRNKKGFIGFLKKSLYKLNNLIHFRQGPA